MACRIIPIIGQSDCATLASKIQRESDYQESHGYELHQTDTVYNGSSYSSILTFKKME